MEKPDQIAPLLAVRALVKDFGANRVLAGVDFDVRPGEVHALLGENGAGKSTLIKIVAGVEPATEGTISVAGRALSTHPTPPEVAAAGVAFVHQDLGLIDSLSVAENIALPHHYRIRRGLVSFRETEAHARDLLRDLEVELKPSTIVGDLHQDQKVLVAVARAFALRARVIVLDEVSASLPTPEFERFAESIRRTTQAGIGYAYVTHRLTEVFDLAQRVTVLRDGMVAGTGDTKDLAYDQVVEWIVGRALSAPVEGTRTHNHAAGPGLRVAGLLGPGLEAPVSFGVKPGEIVAFCGLVGSGVRAVPQLLGGATKPTAGKADLGGRELPLGIPHELAQSGVAYVPGDRDREGAFADLSIRENLFIAPDPRASGLAGKLRPPRSERASARTIAKQFHIKPGDDVERLVATLSGGNRQKVVFARAMRRKPQLLVLDDPTQGVDIGSRAELHALMRTASAEGTAIVFASSDFEEVASQAHRVLVTCQGRVAFELTGAELSANRLAEASYQDINAQSTAEVSR